MIFGYRSFFPSFHGTVEWDTAMTYVDLLVYLHRRNSGVDEFRKLILVEYAQM